MSKLTEEIRRRARLDPRLPAGLVITDIDAKSPCAETLREGMGMLSINNAPVAEIALAKRALISNPEEGDLLRVYYRGACGRIVVPVKWVANAPRRLSAVLGSGRRPCLPGSASLFQPAGKPAAPLFAAPLLVNPL